MRSRVHEAFVTLAFVAAGCGVGEDRVQKLEQRVALLEKGLAAASSAVSSTPAASASAKLGSAQAKRRRESTGVAGLTIYVSTHADVAGAAAKEPTAAGTASSLRYIIQDELNRSGFLVVTDSKMPHHLTVKLRLNLEHNRPKDIAGLILDDQGVLLDQLEVQVENRDVEEFKRTSAKALVGALLKSDSLAKFAASERGQSEP